MANSDRASLRLRAQEIINVSPNGMTVREALKQAAIERYGNNVDALADAFATAASSGMTDLRKRTYELPDEDGALFEIPAAIGIRTERGDLLIPRDRASLDNVRQWQKEGQQHHSTQLLRFKRAGKQLEPLKEEDGALPWSNARNLLTSGDGEEPETEGEADDDDE